MAKAKSKSVRLKGAVLIMVLAVMVVLIIMLTGAMALVSTASSRAYTKYEETQAYYTARSGLEVVTQTLMGDTVHLDKGTNNDGDNRKANNDFNETGNAYTTDKSQALALEEAFTGVLTTDPADPTKTIYDISKSLTCWDVINNPDGTGLSPTEKKNSYMIFDVSDLSGFDDGKSGIFSDAGDGSVQVKMQLLELIFDDGVTTDAIGNYTGKHRNDVVGTKIDVTAGDADAYYIMKLAMLVECTATYNGTSSTVSRVLIPIDRQKQSSNGFDSPGDLQLSDNSHILGNATAGDTITWGNNGTSMGSVYMNSDTVMAVNKKFNLNAYDSIIVNGDWSTVHSLDFLPQESQPTGARTHPYVFVNGTLTTSSNAPNVGQPYTLNAPDWKKTDLIVQNLLLSANDLIKVHGDTYIDGYTNLTFGGWNPGSVPIFGGNFFISDREAFDFNEIPIGNRNGSPATGTAYYGPSDKTNIGDLVYYTADPSNPFAVKFNVNTDAGSNKIWRDILYNGGDNIWAGDIYYYYYADDSNPADYVKYYGCMYLEAIRKYLVDIQSPAHPDNGMYIANMTNLDKFLYKLHPVTPYDHSDDAKIATHWMKYIIQLAVEDTSLTPAFIDGFDFQPAGGGGGSITFSFDIEDDPEFDLRVSLPDITPQAVNHRTSYENSLIMPTMIGKFSQYLFINSVNPLTNARWNPIKDPNVFLDPATLDEITAFTYTDSLTGNYMLNVNWKNEIEDIAEDLFKYKTDTTTVSAALHTELVSRTLDIMNAIYKTDATGDITRNHNVHFIPAALRAYLDNNILFNVTGGQMDFSSVGNIDEPANLPKTLQRLTPGTASNQTINIDTSVNDVILMLDRGTYQNTKIVVSGNNYCYIMLEQQGVPNWQGEYDYTFWNTEIITAQYDSECYASDRLRIGNGGNATWPKVTAPNIYIYADEDVCLNYYNGGKGTFMGYIYGPGSVIRSNGSFNRKDVCYFGNTVNTSINIMGSAFVRDIYVQNGFCFIYIPPVQEKESWEAKFSWQTGGVGYSNRGIKTEND